MSEGNGEDKAWTQDGLKALYTDKVWTYDLYRKSHSPGEASIPHFLKLLKLMPGNEFCNTKGMTVIDWGCGPGRASKLLYENGLNVTAIDFAPNSLDENVRELTQDNDNFRFIEHDITQPTTITSQLGYCCDVMEHLTEDTIDDTLEHILQASKDVFFQIATRPDLAGKHPHIDEELHLTVHDYQWWLKKFAEHNVIVHFSSIARLAEDDSPGGVVFYLTGWVNDKFDFGGGHVNTSLETIKSNIAENSKLLEKGVQNIVPHEANDLEIMLLGGGPTLNDFKDDIAEKRASGMPLVTTNGSYNWAIEQGLSPSLQLVIDAREHNHRFTKMTEGLTDTTKYIIASQCHPSVFDDLPLDRTFVWQVSISPEIVDHVNKHYGKQYEDWYPMPGGSTVMLRAFPLLRSLGYHKIHAYGFDSCVFPGKYHHAYDQVENDDGGPIEMTACKNSRFEKVFLCHPWMVYQVKEFQLMSTRLLQDVDLIVYGDGLIAYMIKVAAEEADETEEVNIDEKDVGTVCYAPLDRRGNIVL